jgi:RDD family
MNSDTVYRMNAYTAPMTGATSDLPRAGFWRRWLAVLIDWIVVIFPFQVMAAILFAVTAGGVQMNNGFFRVCEPASIPQALDPPPPHDSNFANACHVSLFGATTGSTLTVGRITHQGTTTTNVNQVYTVDADGKPNHATSIDWIGQLTFLAYLFVMVCKTGKTLGARVAKVRVVDAAQPGTPGVPFGKVIIRYLVMIIGAVPMLAVLIYQRVAVGVSADAMFTGSFFQWFMYAGALGAVWVLVLVVQIARKTDPVYDRLAGTAVLREPSPSEIPDKA